MIFLCAVVSVPFLTIKQHCHFYLSLCIIILISNKHAVFHLLEKKYAYLQIEYHYSIHRHNIYVYVYIQSIRPRMAASPSIQSVSHITLRHGDSRTYTGRKDVISLPRNVTFLLHVYTCF